MVGANELLLNHATMLKAVELWLADQFKKPPKPTRVSTVPNGASVDFKVNVTAEANEK